MVSIKIVNDHLTSPLAEEQEQVVMGNGKEAMKLVQISKNNDKTEMPI
jgi:hypothetical protein